MARVLFDHSLNNSSQALLSIATFCLCAMALFGCVTHSRKWHKWKACYVYGRTGHDPVIQLNHDGFHDYQLGDTDPSTLSADASIWRKNILMGGKCQLPDFSGVIIYDASGNVVAPSKPPLALEWK
ncbi:hypothetical protein Leryth_021554 [Lithospermum erythrorhizon]|uniref:Lipoprotein n=1 Tax=Lithospermum erythrorhizon TaxID=34254 RepID=A0AAV3NY11_LITER|nr:hypothetical protein Leryth_021554 [Lithospermum erythrorhizon]